MAKKKKNNGAKWIFISLIVVLVGVLGVLFTYSPIELDNRNCPANSQKIKTTLAILLDTTEQYGVSQVQQVVNHIYREVSKLQQYDRILIFSVSEDRSKSLPKNFDLCKPGSDQTKTPVHEEFSKFVFKKKLEKTLETLQGNQPSSPIISSLSSVASQLSSDGENTRIILVSDLVEYSDVISMYQSDWLSKAETDKERLRKLRPMLEGISLDILFLARPDNQFQNKDLLYWWRQYLSDAGAFINQIKPITGN
ncbi:hypothetical protein OAB62_02910 [Pseudomonadales bacterium]|nr:hypothetical protein [Pseudomonadales bacterium]